MRPRHALRLTWRWASDIGSALRCRDTWLPRHRRPAHLPAERLAVAESGRAGAFNPLVSQYLASTDSLAYGAYGLVGYRFNWFGVMPYLVVQHLDHTSPDSSALRINALFVGVNIRPIDVFVFKAEYVEARTPEDNILGTKPLRFMQLQLAWAF